MPWSAILSADALGAFRPKLEDQGTGASSGDWDAAPPNGPDWVKLGSTASLKGGPLIPVVRKYGHGQPRAISQPTCLCGRTNIQAKNGPLRLAAKVGRIPVAERSIVAVHQPSQSHRSSGLLKKLA